MPVVKSKLLKRKEAAINLELKKVDLSISNLMLFRNEYHFDLSRAIKEKEFVMIKRILKKHLGRKGGAW